MPTPKAGYYVNGKRVPSVTTILSRFKASGALVHWSWGIANDGLMEARDIIRAIGMREEDAIRRATGFIEKPITDWDYRTRRDQAADAGTCAHAMMDAWIRGVAFDPEPYPIQIIDMAKPAFDAFGAWSKSHKFKVVETEVPLVSKVHLFGGTRDAILIDDFRALGDWKSSNAIYPEYLCQLAAYGILDMEAGNNIPGGYHLLRFSKQVDPSDPVHFSHHYWSQLDAAAEAFLLMRQLYDLMKRLEVMAK